MIRMNDFTAEPDELRRQESDAVAKVLSSGWFILGREVQAFENEWAAYCGVKHCVGVANGLEAIELGLRGLDIGPGDEVITTPMTAVATVLAIVHAGATPVLADIDAKTALLDRESVQRCVTSRTKALLLVHLYGQMRDMEGWIGLCNDAGIHLLEDCAQAHGARTSGRSAGSLGHFGAFSFYPTKNLGARGDAGAVMTNSDELDARLRVLRNCGSSSRYVHSELGLNSRLDELQAAILRARLPYLAPFNERRRSIAERYRSEIRNRAIVQLAAPEGRESHVYHLFVIRCAERDRLSEFLKKQGIETLMHYPVTVHLQECCRDIQTDRKGLANAETHASQCLSLPCHPQLGNDEVESVISSVNAFR
jgi:dTDP-4-amino-4,6-dideoxygalactose transaminase